jgi:hypothetical protein
VVLVGKRAGTFCLLIVRIAVCAFYWINLAQVVALQHRPVSYLVTSERGVSIKPAAFRQQAGAGGPE